jgi:hypothetical protein
LAEDRLQENHKPGRGLGTAAKPLESRPFDR